MNDPKEETADSVPIFPNGSEETRTQPERERPLAENDSPMTKETMKDLYKKSKRFGIFAVIGGLLFILLYLAEKRFADPEDEFFGKVFLFCGIVIALCGFTLIFMEFFFVKQNSLLTENTHNVYRMYENEIHLLGFEGAQQRDESHVAYEKITKVRKNGRYYYLYLGALVWIVDKDCFTVGSEEVFREILRSKCVPKAIRFK